MSGDRSGSRLEVDYDDTNSDCSVKVFTRPLESFDVGEPAFHHWILGVSFTCGKELFLDAEDVNGKLTPSVTSTRPGNIRVRKDCGIVNTSPFKVCSLALKNKLNFKSYDSLHMNCQMWVDEMLQLLGLGKLNLMQASTLSTLYSIGSSVLFGFPGFIAATLTSGLISSGSRSLGSKPQSGSCGSAGSAFQQASRK